MRIGEADEGGIVAMIPLGHFLYTVKERAIYRFQEADRIDPERTNPDIPHVQQRVVTAGSESIIVSKTFLTGYKLLSPHYFNCGVDLLGTLQKTLDLALLLLSAKEVADALERDQTAALAQRPQRFGNVANVPAVGHVVERANTFVQKMALAVQGVYDMVVAFYGVEAIEANKPRNVRGAYFDGFSNLIRTKIEPNDPMLEVIDSIVGFSKMVRNIRHCIEHQSDTQRLNVTDFSISPDGAILVPQFQIVHPEIDPETTSMLGAFAQFVDTLAELSETTLALICGLECVQEFAGAPIGVAAWPRRWHDMPHVQYGYVVEHNGDWTPLG